jgi:hypothetical protein
MEIGAALLGGAERRRTGQQSFGDTERTPERDAGSQQRRFISLNHASTIPAAIRQDFGWTPQA